MNIFDIFIYKEILYLYKFFGNSMKNVNVDGHLVETNDQGFLLHLDEWSESYAIEMAKIDNICLFTDHWGVNLLF